MCALKGGGGVKGKCTRADASLFHHSTWLLKHIHTHTADIHTNINTHWGRQLDYVWPG